ncbi:hypothetical protein ETAF_1170 [Edwardsiella tarda FL6-60]|uniref:Uncharacterized protein n=1 Tax=Edwardsiella tarda (strain FL6-60) TaxID=718251 RepID=A0A0H3DS39_EDWTF|nr:hypothetical protein ETAF_1170 [Edwardsiella tarda FL6-60]
MLTPIRSQISFLVRPSIKYSHIASIIFSLLMGDISTNSQN